MKGFVYTLEAIIASTIILSTVLLVFPQSSSSVKFETANLEGEVKNLDQRENLSSDINEIENQLEDSLEPGFNLTARQVELDTVSETEIGQNITLSNDVYHNLMMWIDSGSNLSVEFQGEKIVDSFSGSGYVERGFTGKGDLNFTGSGTGNAKVIEYPASGSFSSRENAFTINYVTNLGNASREVRLRVWR